MPKGVICGGAVEGSNQLGAMVTCQAMVASPAGAVWAAAPRAVARVSPAASSSETIPKTNGSRETRPHGPMFVTCLGAIRSRNSPLGQLLAGGVHHRLD